uniref:Secreted protein n=1 Tax=Caenorhabditis tropicalis TaxID=1561998 RepID=A0A1I7UG10_9PELO
MSSIASVFLFFSVTILTFHSMSSIFLVFTSISPTTSFSHWGTKLIEISWRTDTFCFLLASTKTLRFLTQFLAATVLCERAETHT